MLKHIFRCRILLSTLTLAANMQRYSPPFCERDLRETCGTAVSIRQLLHHSCFGDYRQSRRCDHSAVRCSPCPVGLSLNFLCLLLSAVSAMLKVMTPYSLTISMNILEERIASVFRDKKSQVRKVAGYRAVS